MKNKIISNLFAHAAVVFAFAACASAQIHDDKQKPLTTDGRYVVIKSLRLKKAYEKIDGRLEILQDARLTDDVSIMQSNGFPPDLYSEDEKIKETFEKETFRSAVLRLTDTNGKILDSLTLDCVDASFKRVYLYSPAKPSYEVTCTYTNVAPYGGDETFFYDLKNARLARLEAIDSKTRKPAEMSFVWSHRCGWDYAVAGAGRDILNVYTDFEKESGDAFVRYERFRFDGQRWIKYERIEKDDYWEDESGFPKLAEFPKARKR